MVKTKYILSFGASDTVKSAKIVNNGFIKYIHLSVPNFDEDVTTTLSIEDEEGTTIWEDSARDRNTDYIIGNLNIPSDIKYTLTATLSEGPGGDGGNVIVKVFFGTV